jgi:hypothetical protein
MFHTYIAIVLSRCCICFAMTFQVFLHVFRALFQVCSSVFRRMLQMCHLDISKVDGYCACCIGESISAIDDNATLP